MVTVVVEVDQRPQEAVMVVGAVAVVAVVVAVMVKVAAEDSEEVLEEAALKAAVEGAMVVAATDLYRCIAIGTEYTCKGSAILFLWSVMDCSSTRMHPLPLK